MDERQTISLSDAEWLIMQVLWKAGDCTLKHILDEVFPLTGWTKHSVISFLKRMEAKGAIVPLETHPRGYHALLDRAQTVQAETEQIVQRVYGGDLRLMVSSAVHQAQLSDQEVDELIKILKKGCEDHA